MKRIQSKSKVITDKTEIINEANRLVAQRLSGESRRRFLQFGLTLVGITLLTGCDLSESQSVDLALQKISRFNDRVQAWLFSGTRLAPEYSREMITRPFPFNAYHSEDEIVQMDGNTYRLEISGLVSDKRSWSLPQLYKMAQVEQITRHICVEGWSAIGRWGGIPFTHFLKTIGADLTAQYIAFRCFDDYYTSIDMATALHPQTLLALNYDGKLLPAKYGFPMKLRMPTKLGYKNPKYIQSIEVTNHYPGGYWEDQGYNWFGGS